MRAATRITSCMGSVYNKFKQPFETIAELRARIHCPRLRGLQICGQNLLLISKDFIDKPISFSMEPINPEDGGTSK